MALRLGEDPLLDGVLDVGGVACEAEFPVDGEVIELSVLRKLGVRIFVIATNPLFRPSHLVRIMPNNPHPLLRFNLNRRIGSRKNQLPALVTVSQENKYASTLLVIKALHTIVMRALEAWRGRSPSEERSDELE